LRCWRAPKASVVSPTSTCCSCIAERHQAPAQFHPAASCRPTRTPHHRPTLKTFSTVAGLNDLLCASLERPTRQVHAPQPTPGCHTRCVVARFLRGARLPAAAWTASRSVNRANRCGNPSFQFFAILAEVVGVSSEARWHEPRGRGAAMCKMQAHR
jgi:hypothetical protein